MHMKRRSFAVVNSGGQLLCKNCESPVSESQDFCVSCDQVLAVYGVTELEANTARRVEEQKAHMAREAEKLRRKQIQDQYWMDRGVEPGPLAFYRAWPEWLQAITLSLMISLPLAIGFFAIRHLLLSNK